MSKKLILNPAIMSELAKLYESSTTEEKNSFAEVVNSVLIEESGNEIESKRLEYEKQARLDEEIPSVKYRDPLQKLKKKEEEIEALGEELKLTGMTKGKKTLYGILSDFEIIHLAHKGMISPFINYLYSGKGKNKRISYGLSGYAYVIRTTNMYLSVSSAKETILDPKDPPIYDVEECQKDGKIVLPPGSTILCVSLENLRIPEGIIVTPSQLGEYMNCGVQIYGQIIDAPYEGRYSMLVKNLNKDKSTIIYTKEGILKLRFERPFCLTKKAFEEKNLR